MRVDSSTSSAVGLEQAGVGADHRAGVDGDHAAADQGLGRHRRGPAALEDGRQDLVRLVERRARPAPPGSAGPRPTGRWRRSPRRSPRHRRWTRPWPTAPRRPPAPGRAGWPARPPRPDRTGTARTRCGATGPRRARASARGQARSAGAELREHVVGLELVPRRPGRRDGAAAAARAPTPRRALLPMASSAATLTLVSAGRLRWCPPATASSEPALDPSSAMAALLPAHLVRHARRPRRRRPHPSGRRTPCTWPPHTGTSPGETPTPTSEAPSAITSSRHSDSTTQPSVCSPRIESVRAATTVDGQVGPDAGDEPGRAAGDGHHVLGLLGGVDQLDRTRARAASTTENTAARRSPWARPKTSAPRGSRFVARRGTEVGREVELRDRADRPPRPPLHEESPAPGRRGCAGADAPRRGRSRSSSSSCSTCCAPLRSSSASTHTVSTVSRRRSALESVTTTPRSASMRPTWRGERLPARPWRPSARRP